MVLTALVLAAVLADARADRETLFQYVLAKTLARESFSPVKNERLGLDVGEAMERVRAHVLDADTDEDLFYALVELSNTRKDRHLTVDLVEGGLDFPRAHEPEREAPVRFSPDYSDPGAMFLFVRDASESANVLPGDRVLGVNGVSFEQYFHEIEPYHRYSTRAGLWWQVAEWLPRRSYLFPSRFYRNELELELEKRSGERYRVALPYLPSEEIRWQGRGARRYPGYDLAYSTETYDLLQNFEGENALILVWHGFRENLVADVDRLIEHAASKGLLDHAVLFDGTRSRGGSMGVYALQRLSPKPFRATFGNLRLSDVTATFVERVVASRAPEDAWLIDWLTDDVKKGLASGQDYSNLVPFKLTHLPKYSDGTVRPAPVHFRGPLVCFFSPHGGSHLDQFAAMVADNRLGATMGMPAGGYSNTWEWEEVLELPSGKPLVRYMWSIGHTVRPNGQILEGNPAEVDEFVPLTRDNFDRYYEELLTRAYQRIGIR